VIKTVQLIIGTQGRINDLLRGIPAEDIVDFHVNNDKAWVIVKDEAVANSPNIVEKEVEVIKEVIKEVKVDNPELLDDIENLKETLADSLNAEQEAKKIAEDAQMALEKERTKHAQDIEKLKKQVEKLKAAI
jgi:ABC-type Fe3+-hydroxamate transport system substrate-binding protein